MNTLIVLANSANPIKEFYTGNLTNLMVQEFKKYGFFLNIVLFNTITLFLHF